MFAKYYPQPSGRVKAVIENRAKDATIKSKSKTFENHTDAELWANSMMATLKKQHLSAVGKTKTLSASQINRVMYRNRDTKLNENSLVREVISEYLRFTNTVPKPASQTAQEALKTIQKYSLADSPLTLISYKTLENYCKERLVKVCPSTTRIEISALARAIRELKEADKFEKTSIGKVSDTQVLSHYPTLKKQGFIADAERRTRRIRDEQELTQLLGAAQIFSKRSLRKHRFDLLILMYIETMLRARELVSIRWEDVDLERGYFTLKVGKNVKLGTNGTAESPREVPLTSKAKEILTELKTRDNMTGLVFNISPSSVTTVFPRIKSHAKIKGLQLRDLRREGVSRKVEEGYSILQIAAFTGHRDLQMITDIYNAAKARNIVM